MFNTFFDSEDQNIDFNIQSQKQAQTNSKNCSIIDAKNYFYFEKDNKTNKQLNIKINVNNNTRYTEQKYNNNITKIRIIIYQNGFIVNNGEFRNKSIPENRRFLEEIQRGDIPIELIKKGIMNAEILLENRKNEVYYSTYYQNTDNNYIDTNIFQNPLEIQNQDPDLYSLLYNNSNNNNNYNYNQNNELNLPSPSITNTYNVHNKNKNKDQNQESLYSSNTFRADNRTKKQKNVKRKNSQNTKNFVDFLEFKKENDEKEKNKKKKEDKDEKKEFKAFSGFGQIIGNINTEGLYVNKDVSTLANFYNPICYVNIRLFNGEIIKAPFNYDQTVGDIYIYVRKVSGSNNFVLLEGFPPKEIVSYGSPIYQLGLQNNVITQKIK